MARLWKDRVVEKPRTFTIQNNPDGTVTLIPGPGVIVEAGTPVNAANLNGLEDDLETHKADYATDIELGHVKVGKGLSLNDGTISVKVGIVDVNNVEFVAQMEVDKLLITNVSLTFPIYVTYAGATITALGYSCIVEDDEFVYAIIDALSRGIVKLNKLDLSLVATNDSIAEISNIFIDDLYIYTIPKYGATITANQCIRKIKKSDLTLVTQSPIIFRWIRGFTTDADFIYVCGHGTLQGYQKVSKATLTVIAENKTIDTDWFNIVVDSTYLYISRGSIAGAYNTARTVKIDKNTLVQVAQSPTRYVMNDVIIDMDENYLLGLTQPTSSSNTQAYAVIRKSDLLVDRQILATAAPLGISVEFNKSVCKNGYLYCTQAVYFTKILLSDWSIVMQRSFTGSVGHGVLVKPDYCYVGTIINNDTPTIYKIKDVEGRPALQETYYNGITDVPLNLGVELQSVTYKIKQILRRVG